MALVRICWQQKPQGDPTADGIEIEDIDPDDPIADSIDNKENIGPDNRIADSISALTGGKYCMNCAITSTSDDKKKKK